LRIPAVAGARHELLAVHNCGASAWLSTYNYDSAGNVVAWTHPAGFTITNTYNAAMQTTGIISSLCDSEHRGTYLHRVR